MEWSAEEKQYLRGAIRDVEGFKPGIVFYDITTLLKDAKAFGMLLSGLAKRYAGYKLDYVVGIESRGFIFGAPLAASLGVGFVPVRKKGKLPAETLSEKYALEYGFDEVEIHRDAFANKPKARVLLVDDLIATGGTAEASLRLVRAAGAECVESCFLLHLVACGGKKRIESLAPVFSVLDI